MRKKVSGKSGTPGAGILVFLLLLFATLPSLAQKGLQPGDIVFQNLPCGGMCDAIIATTPCQNNRRFNHCGVVIKEGKKLFVVEAIGKAVQKSPLQKFTARDTAHVLFAGRAKASLKERKRFAQNSLRYVGRPYDDPFLPGDSALYCSELVWEAFSQNGRKLFPQKPMTFKENGQTHPAWKAYYEDLKQPIPEGILGINPCAIANSPEIRFFSVRK